MLHILIKKHSPRKQPSKCHEKLHTRPSKLKYTKASIHFHLVINVCELLWGKQQSLKWYSLHPINQIFSRNNTVFNRMTTWMWKRRYPPIPLPTTLPAPPRPYGSSVPFENTHCCLGETKERETCLENKLHAYLFQYCFLSFLALQRHEFEIVTT